MKAIGMLLLLVAIISLIVGGAERLIPLIQGEAFQADTTPGFIQPHAFLKFSMACSMIAIGCLLAAIAKSKE